MLSIEKYTSAHEQSWQQILTDNASDMFMLNRRYIEYHKNNYADESVVVFQGNKAIALVAANKDREDPSIIVSHSGLSYGGVLFSKQVCYLTALEVISALVEYFRVLGYKQLKLKVVPSIYFDTRFDFIEHILHKIGFRIDAIELSSTLLLDDKITYSKMRKRCLKKAQLHDVLVKNDWSYISEFWDILNDNLVTKYNVTSVHTLAEIEYLKKIFKNNIQLFVALHNNKVIAGNVYFDTSLVRHSQYTATNQIGRSMSGLDILTDTAIKQAKIQNKKYFDFGISTEQQGSYVNYPLLDYKNSFGALMTINKKFLLDYV